MEVSRSDEARGHPTDDRVLAAFPNEPIDHDTKEHYRARLERRLVVNRCGSCRRWHQPPMPCCPSCWSFEVAAEEVSGKGTVYMGARLHQGPPTPGVDYSTPYTVVTVELAEQAGLRITAPLVEATSAVVRAGAPVRLAWIERDGTPAPAFRPLPVGPCDT